MGIRRGSDSGRGAADFPYFDNGGLPIAMAHRGGDGGAPQAADGHGSGLENTMLAFEHCVRLGYRYIETDVHATADGVLVAFHDATLDRVTDVAGAIADLEYADLARARILGEHPIPVLSELFTTWPDVKFNIDAKSPGSVRLLAQAVREHRAWDRVCAASFSVRSLSELRELLGPRVATSYSWPEIGALRLSPIATARRRVGHRAQAAQVPPRPRLVQRLDLATLDFIARVHDVGSVVHYWTINDEAEMRRLLDLGADGIISDRVDALHSVFVERGIWRG